MKKFIIVCFSLLLLTSLVEAKDVIVWLKKDGSVLVTPIENGFDVDRVVKRTRIGMKLGDIDHEIIDDSLLPPDEKRNGWEKRKGQQFTINEEKLNHKPVDVLVKEKMKELAQAELIKENKIELKNGKLVLKGE